MAEQIPDWFHEVVTRGLQALVVLHLPGGPGHDTIAYTRDVWVQTLWDAPVKWSDKPDSKRIETAFRRLMRQADRWPPPRQLLELMPSRPTPPALPMPQMSKAQREANSRRLREALREALKND